MCVERLSLLHLSPSTNSQSSWHATQGVKTVGTTHLRMPTRKPSKTERFMGRSDTNLNQI
ncbi:hypothetical protein PILCRDRAFT_814992 [Piloderma croceum F 1598]|uniref:Uncharacterized protein n=1 Tax=Piloderma croceum (strain F 1598) TaxID=765440 RepID=A0A0C3FTB2_PILCF|nr:hypothetical protein PILCRDRAFT_814992 [Piloderma croceum F 1598]